MGWLLNSLIPLCVSVCVLSVCVVVVVMVVVRGGVEGFNGKNYDYDYSWGSAYI